jgi:hypothetical protein
MTREDDLLLKAAYEDRTWHDRLMERIALSEDQATSPLRFTIVARRKWMVTSNMAQRITTAVAWAGPQAVHL